MSKFFKALEEAERDRALRTGTAGGAARPQQSMVASSRVSAAVAAAPAVPAPREEPAWPERPIAGPFDGMDERLVSADLPSMELQQLWFALLRRRAWSSLVVIPAHAGGSAVSTARGLAGVAERHLGRRVAVITPGELCSLDELPRLMPALAEREPAERLEGAVWEIVLSDSIRTHTHHPGLGDLMKTPSVIVALEPVVSNPLGIAVTLAADAALLCITLGETSLASAKRTVELVGRERFIGCVVRRP